VVRLIIYQCGSNEILKLHLMSDWGVNVNVNGWVSVGNGGVEFSVGLWLCTCYGLS